MLSRTHTITEQLRGWIIIVIMWLVVIAILTGVGHLQVEKGDSSLTEIDSGDTAWMMIATCLVLIMTLPGLVLYYGGFSNKPSQINTMAMVFVSYALVTAVWICYGYALAFGDDVAGGLIGNGRKIFLQGLSQNSISTAAPTIPEYLYCAFESCFASLTVALACAGLIERIKFTSYVYFVVLWTTFVYLPIAHWVWGGGFLSAWGVIDYAGGTVVHINSGIAALVGTIIMKKRLDPHENPRSIGFVMMGTGFLWFGWFGFNGGSSLYSGAKAGIAFINTNTAASVSSIVWITIQKFHIGKPTLAGLCDGAIAGLVGIAPAAGYVNTMGAIIIGIAVGVLPYGAIILKSKINLYDDTLNTFSIHYSSGTLGALLVGIYADPDIGGKTGILYGHPRQLGLQVAGILACTAWSAIVTGIILLILKSTVGIRVSELEEEEGLDKSQHGDVAYNEYQNESSQKILQRHSISKSKVGSGIEELSHS